MTHAQREAVAAGIAARPMLHHEHERRAALIEASILDARELISTRQPDDTRAEEPRSSDLGTLRKQERVLYVDPEVSDRALDLRVPEQDLHGA